MVIGLVVYEVEEEVPTSSVPGAPTSLIATPHNTSFTLQFTTPESVGASAILYYTITTEPFTSATKVSVPSCASDSLGTSAATSTAACTQTETVENIPNDVTYQVFVTATNQNGEGDQSESTTVMAVDAARNALVELFDLLDDGGKTCCPSGIGTAPCTTDVPVDCANTLNATSKIYTLYDESNNPQYWSRDYTNGVYGWYGNWLSGTAITVTNKSVTHINIPKLYTISEADVPVGDDWENYVINGDISSFDKFGDLPDLKSFSSFGNNLRGQLPASIGKLTKLTTLELQDNCFSGDLPGEMVDMKYLRILNLKYNDNSVDPPRSGWCPRTGFSGIPSPTLDALLSVVGAGNPQPFMDGTGDIVISSCKLNGNSFDKPQSKCGQLPTAAVTSCDLSC